MKTKYSIPMALISIKKALIFSLIICGTLSSCVSVKAYQKSYLNDADMQLANRKVERFDSYFQFYREGAAGANGGKTGGGCGCN
mgnify:FL=1|jgi:hypothetical protein